MIEVGNLVFCGRASYLYFSAEFSCEGDSKGYQVILLLSFLAGIASLCRFVALGMLLGIGFWEGCRMYRRMRSQL